MSGGRMRTVSITSNQHQSPSFHYLHPTGAREGASHQELLTGCAILAPMAITKNETARELVEWHFRVEPDLKQVLRIFADAEDAPDEPIKLLEANVATVATGSVEPFAFSPSEAVPFPTVIAEVTPEEFESIQRNEIKLPSGWSLNKAQLFERPQAA